MNYQVIKLPVSDKEFHSMLVSAFKPMVVIVNANLTNEEQKIYILEALNKFYDEKSEKS